MRLAIVASHPVQYYAPLYRELSLHAEVTVFYAHRATPADQAKAGFGIGFDWDVDLTSGYEHRFLANVSGTPGTGHFAGCDCPEIGARLREGKFDAVMLQGWYLKVFIQALFAAKRLGLPVLVRGDSQLGTPRPGVKRLVKALAYPPLLRFFDAALYVGGRSKAYLRYYGYPESRLFFSPHCVDNDWFAARATPTARAQLRGKLGIAPETKVALFAGKLVPFKRPLDLVAATGKLRSQGQAVDVLIAGAGPLEQALREAAREAGIALHMLGFCNQTEMPAAYAAADVLVLPSDGRETWGLVANEALACGLPILLSDAVGSAADLSTDGLAGSTFYMGDVALLAERLGSIIARPPLRQTVLSVASGFSLGRASDGVLAACTAVAPVRSVAA